MNSMLINNTNTIGYRSELVLEREHVLAVGVTLVGRARLRRARRVRGPHACRQNR